MPWLTSIWVVAPGQPPPALTFLFAPLRCYWIPWAPPSVHCCHRLSCSVSVSQCMGCARTWAAQGSQSGQLCTPPYPVLRSLLPVSDLSPENLDSSLLLTAMHFFLFLIPVKDFCLSLPNLPSLTPFPFSVCAVFTLPRSCFLSLSFLEHAGEQYRTHVCIGLLSCFYPLSCMQFLLPL